MECDIVSVVYEIIPRVLSAKVMITWSLLVISLQDKVVCGAGSCHNNLVTITAMIILCSFNPLESFYVPEINFVQY